MNSADLKKQALDYNIANNKLLMDICKPLKQFGITTFFYVRYYSNKIFNLSTHQKWFSVFAENNLCDSFQPVIDEIIKRKQILSSTIITDESSFLRSMYLESAPYEEKSLGKDYFSLVSSCNIYQVIATLNYCGDYIENFGFATDRRDVDITMFCLNNADLISRFQIYFKERAQDILASEESNLCFPTKLILNTPQNMEDVKRRDFINATKIKKVIMNCGSKEVFLSTKEASILHQLSRGKTAKEIAIDTSFSPRTVEGYIENIKKKTSLNSKSELVDLFYSNFNLLNFARNSSVIISN